jgi:hypothetical protein
VASFFCWLPTGGSPTKKQGAATAAGVGIVVLLLLLACGGLFNKDKGNPDQEREGQAPQRGAPHEQPQEREERSPQAEAAPQKPPEADPVEAERVRATEEARKRAEDEARRQAEREAKVEAEKKQRAWMERRAQARLVEIQRLQRGFTNSTVIRAKFTALITECAGTRAAEEAKELLRSYVDALAERHLSYGKKLLDEGKVADARDRFQRVINDFPTTKAAEEAKRLLKGK